MGDRNQLDVKGSGGEAPADRDDLDLDLRCARLAAALGLQQRGGERRRIDWYFEPRPQIEHRTEMVLMRVREHDADQIAFLLGDIADVRQDQIDTRQLIFRRERHAEIDDQPFALAALPDAVKRQVHADLAYAAERREHQIRLRGCHAQCLASVARPNTSPAVTISVVPSA